MAEQTKTLVILTPAFALNGENWLMPQALFVRKLNELFPSLKVVILVFHFPLVVERRLEWQDNEVVCFNGGMKSGANTVLRWMQVWRELKRLHKQHELVGLFSFFCSESAFIGHYFARRNNLKHLIWILGQDALKENKQVGRIRPHAEELVAISDFLVREFERNHGIRPAHLVPIGISREQFDMKPQLRDIDIIGVGTLSAIKQYDVFIDVVKALSEKLPGLKAVICGDGNERTKLQEQINTAGLSDVIRLAGEQPHEEVLRMMQRSKLLLHPSSYEGFGMVCAEALYAGAQVISFCRPMDREIKHWSIVQDRKEMLAKAYELLSTPEADHEPVLAFPMEETAMQIMRLFGYAPARQQS